MTYRVGIHITRIKDSVKLKVSSSRIENETRFIVTPVISRYTSGSYVESWGKRPTEKEGRGGTLTFGTVVDLLTTLKSTKSDIRSLTVRFFVYLLLPPPKVGAIDKKVNICFLIKVSNMKKIKVVDGNSYYQHLLYLN